MFSHALRTALRVSSNLARAGSENSPVLASWVATSRDALAHDGGSAALLCPVDLVGCIPFVPTS